MIIKPILNGVAKHLENVYGVDTFTQSGLRLTYVVYEAFERSVYRELKNITNGKRNANIVKTIYDIAEGIKL